MGSVLVIGAAGFIGFHVARFGKITENAGWSDLADSFHAATST